VAEAASVPRGELRLVQVLNDLPGGVASALHPVMQLGTVVAPLVVAVLIGLARRDLASGLATAVVGVVAWLGAKEVKQIVDRDRPMAFLTDLVVREDVGPHLGYPSGHSAVAAATAVMVAAALPARRRWIPALAAAVVGVARIVHGVHLPADVVGGWSLGVLVALVGLAVLDRGAA
jgi:undecaprenyl-diphosphatase